MTIDDIDPDKPTVMTAGISRLFAAAGCSPTTCHACRTNIKIGNIFKLVPHRKPYPSVAGLVDEMCCEKCGESELLKRDEREKISPPSRNFRSVNRSTGKSLGGYSRPSKAAASPEGKLGEEQ